MGMFDEVRCNHEIFGDEKGSVKQTKEFDCFMEMYEITPEGRLVLEAYEIEDRSDPNAPKGSIESLMGCMTPVPTGEKVDMHFHGWLHFSCDGRCKFTDGQLVEYKKKVLCGR